MPSFVVETYVAPGDTDRIGELAALAGALESNTAIRHVGSLVLLADEVCLHVFEAPSADALVETGRLVGLAYERVVETIWIAGRTASQVVESR